MQDQKTSPAQITESISVDLTRDMPNGSRIIAELRVRAPGDSLPPGFSLCGSLYEKHGTWSGKARQQNGREADAGGQITNEILRAFPHLADFAKMHLSDLDGVQMHAYENGLYFCQKMDFGLAMRLWRVDSLPSAVRENTDQQEEIVREFVDKQRPRWKAGAQAAYDLILSAVQEQEDEEE